METFADNNAIDNLGFGDEGGLVVLRGMISEFLSKYFKISVKYPSK